LHDLLIRQVAKVVAVLRLEMDIGDGYWRGRVTIGVESGMDRLLRVGRHQLMGIKLNDKNDKNDETN
jgi:hypothetical protein